MLLNEDPRARIVVLVDALDELRYHERGGGLITWLANCPPLPTNVQIVLTSRPDDDLLRTFRQKQGAGLAELRLDLPDVEIRRHLESDLAIYAGSLVGAPAVARSLMAAKVTPKKFISSAVAKADGNFAYLDGLRRAIEQAGAQGDSGRLAALLKLDDIPPGLEELYAFFLHQAKARVRDERVEIENRETDEVEHPTVWPAVYSPILGALTVAREPLTPDQIRQIGHIQAGWNGVIAALDELRQFLDQVGDGYSFYHATLPEFLARPSTRASAETRDLYQEPATWHRRIVQAYRRQVSSNGWAQADWSGIDEYGWRNLVAHAVAADDGANRSPPQLLFELCDAGFMPAKRRTVSSPAFLEEDWRRIFEAAREAGDFRRCVVYGMQRSRQFTELTYLANRSVAYSTASLIARRHDEAACERLAFELSMISHPVARVQAFQSLLDVLIQQRPTSSVVDVLSHELAVALSALPPSADRENAAAAFVWALVRAKRASWQQVATAELVQAASVLPRVWILASTARGHAEACRPDDAAAAVRQALIEADGISIGRPEETLPALLVSSVFRQDWRDPREVLYEALSAILEIAPSLGPDACTQIVTETRKRFKKVQNPDFVMRLRMAAAQALAGAGLERLARQHARRLLKPCLTGTDYPRETEPGRRIDNLLLLLPIVHLLSDPVVTQAWRERFGEHIGRVTFVGSLDRVAWSTAERSSIPGLAELIRPLLTLVDTQVRASYAARFSTMASLALAHGRLGNRDQATEWLSVIIEKVSADVLERSPYPERSRWYAHCLTATWRAACIIGDPVLVQEAYDWLVTTTTAALAPSYARDVWVGAAADLERLADLDLADRLLGSLATRFYPMDSAAYEATAFRQLADAYRGLEMHDEARRRLDVSAQLTSTVESRQLQRYLFLQVAPEYAAIGDWHASAQVLGRATSDLTLLEADEQRALMQAALPALASLVDQGDAGRAAATDLLARISLIIGGCQDWDTAVSMLASLVRMASEHGMTGPVTELSRRLDGYLDSHVSHERLMHAIAAVAALHAADESDDAGALLSRVGQGIRTLPTDTDTARLSVCETIAALGRLSDMGAMIPDGEAWTALARTMSDSISDPGACTRAALALVKIDVHWNGGRRAVDLFRAAISHWESIGEWIFAENHLDAIFSVWADLPRLDDRLVLIPVLSPITWRIPDLTARDRLQARIANAVLGDVVRYRELTVPILGPGLNDQLDALHRADSLEPGIVPDTLYDVLDKSTRDVLAIFAGNALLATQVAVRHHALPSDTVTATLMMLESAIRDLCNPSADPA